jgi:hypothetical protein
MEEWHKQWPRRSLILRVTLFLEEEKPVPPMSLSAPQPQARGRRTAIQAQLNTLPHVLAAEKAGNNLMPSITDRWACISTRCRNKGKTCWRSKKPGAPDTADNHYPVPSDLLFRWSKEVREKAFTVEQPSSQLVLALSRLKNRNRKKDAPSGLNEPGFAVRVRAEPVREVQTS